MKTIIVIPARMASSRFPNKPMALINNKPMIAHVWERAIKADIGPVIVACCEEEVSSCIKSLGGDVMLTDPNIPSGTDRVYEAIKNMDLFQTLDSIINLQGDMPLIDPGTIKYVNSPIIQGFDISTLATSFSNENEKKNINVTKVEVRWITRNKMGEALDFNKDINNINNEGLFHHVGIYGFTPNALKQFVNLPPSKREIKLKLEQMRALDNKMKIGVSYVKNIPISVDTKDDLVHAENILNKNEK